MEKTTGRLRVMVVDDEASIRQIMKIHLRRLKCDVIEAKNGEEALDMALMSRLDLIFLDIMMPFMDGYACIQALRAREGPSQDAPVVAVSALRSQLDRDRAKELGFTEYITKPFQASQIKAIVERFREAGQHGDDASE